MAFFLDTNIFIAKIKETDEFKQDAEDLLVQIKSGREKCYSSVVSLMECAYVMKKFGRGKKEINDALHALTEIDNIVFLPLTVGILKEASDIMILRDLALSDAIIAATTVSNSIEVLVSEDSDFDGIPFIKRISIKDACGKMSP